MDECMPKKTFTLPLQHNSSLMVTSCTRPHKSIYFNARMSCNILIVNPYSVESSYGIVIPCYVRSGNYCVSTDFELPAITAAAEF
jgi:hypothetical protein